jgi:hypothetical protein
MTYKESLEKFRAASRKYSEIAKAYRERKIGDSEFLKGRRAFDKAQHTMDVAEAKEDKRDSKR